MSNRRLTSELVVRLLDKVSGPAKAVSRGLLGIRSSADKVGQGSIGERLTASIKRNQLQLDQTRGRLVDVAAGFYAIKAAIGAPVQAAMAFESAMADVKKVVDFGSDSAFEKFQRDLEGLSTQLPVSTAQLADIAASAGEAGFAGEELIKVTEAAAQIGVAFGVSAEKAGETLPEMMSAMKLSLDEVLLLSDGINHLSNNMATNAPKLLDFMNGVAGDVSGFGMSAKEAVAFGAAMTSAGARADVAATSFRNMGNRLTKGASATSRQKAAFKQLGLDATNVAKNMQEDGVGTTIKVLEAIRAIPKEMQTSIRSDLFGDEARALAPLLGNIDLLKNALGLVSDEAGYAGSAFEEFAVRNETYGANLQRFQNRLTNLKAAIGRGLIPVLTDLIEKITPVISKISELANAHPRLIGAVAAATASVIGFKVALIGLKYVGLLGKGGALSMLSLGFQSVGRASLNLRTAVGESIRLQNALAGFQGQKVSSLGKVAAGFRGLAGVTGLSAVSSGIGAVVASVAAISAPVWIAIGGAVAAVGLAWRYWDRISAILGGVSSAIGQQLSPVLTAIKEKLDFLQPVIGPVADAFSSFGTIVSGAIQKVKDIFAGGLFEREILSDGEADILGAKAANLTNSIINGFKSLRPKLREAGLKAIQGLLDGMTTKVSELIAWVKTIPGKIVAAIGKINLSSMIKWPSRPKWLGGGDTPKEGASVDGARAYGGPIKAGATYEVGEQGREIITPDRDGWVTSNHEIIAGLRERAKAAAAIGAFASAPVAAAASAPTIHVNMAPVTIEGVQDIRGAAEEIGRVMANEARRALDGAFIDGG